MTELHVLDRFTDERNDYLEPEIAEKLSTEHRETVDGKPYSRFCDNLISRAYALDESVVSYSYHSLARVNIYIHGYYI